MLSFNIFSFKEIVWTNHIYEELLFCIVKYTHILCVICWNIKYLNISV